MRSAILLLGIFSIAVPTAAHAQRFQEPGLSGLNDFRILIETLDEDAKACGLDRNVVDTSLRFVLQQSKIRISEASIGSPYIYAQITVLPSCTASVYLSINTAVTIQKTNKTVYGAKIWDRGTLTSGSRANARTRATNALESLAKELVIDWAAANN